MNKTWISFLILTTLGFTSQGQTFIQNTMYDLNRFVYNPAAAGLNEQGRSTDWNLGLLGRLQWAGIDGSPRLINLQIHRSLGIGGIGAYLMRDEIGPLSSTSVQGSYAYHMDLNGGNGILGFGLSAGISQRSLNMTVLSVVPEPLLNLQANGTNFSVSTVTPTLALGIFYHGIDTVSGYEKYFFGISGQDLLEPSISDLLVNPSQSGSNVPRSFYATAGYRFEMDTWTSASYNYIQPSIMARFQGTVFQSDISLTAKYSRLYAGLNYRGLAFAGSNSESVGAMLGFDVEERVLSFYYSYDYNLTGLNINGDASSHEIMLVYRFGGGSDKEGKGKDGNVIKD
ncbi:MAG: PorP/SprF family type IX secretion system membrane protein [Bacteroidia bacterium]